MSDPFKECQRFFNHHPPVKLKDQLKLLSEEASSDESSDFYGNGKLIEDFEAEVGKILGKDKSLFMPSGTMAQAMALRMWCDKKNNPNIGLHPSSHLERHEEKSYMHLHNLKGHLLGKEDRVLSLQDILNVNEKLAAVIIELPQRESGGLLPSWSELKEISQWCKNNEVIFHLDGARLWECGPYFEKSYSEICALFDSVYVSFYKGLGGMGGAILSGPEDFIQEAKVWQRRLGGNLITLYPYVVSARKALRTRLNKMQDYHTKAKEVAALLSTIKNITIKPLFPQSNMMHIFFEGSTEQFEKNSLKVAQEDKVYVFRKLQLGGKYELSVGDALLDMSNEEIYKIMKKIAEI